MSRSYQVRAGERRSAPRASHRRPALDPPYNASMRRIRVILGWLLAGAVVLGIQGWGCAPGLEEALTADTESNRRLWTTVFIKMACPELSEDGTVILIAPHSDGRLEMLAVPEFVRTTMGEGFDTSGMIVERSGIVDEILRILQASELVPDACIIAPERLAADLAEVPPRVGETNVSVTYYPEDEDSGGDAAPAEAHEGRP